MSANGMTKHEAAICERCNNTCPAFASLIWQMSTSAKSGTLAWKTV